MDKTNVMRILDSKHIVYQAHEYDSSLLDGVSVARALGQDESRVFKTLVTVCPKGVCYVFVIPVAMTLDLKKSAKAVGVKSLEMLKQKDLLPKTGYIHGGCSPIGMKKVYKTTIHTTALDYDTIIFSAGRIGYQVELNPLDIEKVISVTFSDIVV